MALQGDISSEVVLQELIRQLQLQEKESPNIGKFLEEEGFIPFESDLKITANLKKKVRENYTAFFEHEFIVYSMEEEFQKQIKRNLLKAELLLPRDDLLDFLLTRAKELNVEDRMKIEKLFSTFILEQQSRNSWLYWFSRNTKREKELAAVYLGYLNEKSLKQFCIHFFYGNSFARSNKTIVFTIAEQT